MVRPRLLSSLLLAVIALTCLLSLSSSYRLQQEGGILELRTQSEEVGSRRLTQSGGVSSPKVCLNSVQGMTRIVDQRGVVCLRKDVGGDGCCTNELEKLSCETCNTGLGCCTTLENCVSCCLKQAGAGEAKAFVGCLDKCRSDAKSTNNGNEYKHPFHYCYGQDDNTPHPFMSKMTLSPVRDLFISSVRIVRVFHGMYGD
jgi:hypothetical protein